MKRCRFSALAAGLILSGSLCLSGCSVGLKDAYSLKERVPSIEASFAAEDEAAKGFASDLCVISDEGSFDPEDVTSQAGALFDLTDREVLYSKDAFEKMYPASITKVMTSLIAIKYGNLEDQVTVTEDAVISESGATLCGIKPGDTLTLEQLLYGLMLPSGNDAGAAIAIHMAGSIDAFADMMNEEAKRLGATDTHFMNPHGLHDEDHYTTAYDLYLIFSEFINNPYLIEADRARGIDDPLGTDIPLSMGLPFLIILFCWFMIIYASQYNFNKKHQEFGILFTCGFNLLDFIH